MQMKGHSKKEVEQRLISLTTQHIQLMYSTVQHFVYHPVVFWIVIGEGSDGVDLF